MSVNVFNFLKGVRLSILIILNVKQFVCIDNKIQSSYPVDLNGDCFVSIILYNSLQLEIIANNDYTNSDRI